MFLKINVGSVDKKLYILKNAALLNEVVASRIKIYINADLTKKERKQHQVLRDELEIHKDACEMDQR